MQIFPAEEKRSSLKEESWLGANWLWLSAMVVLVALIVLWVLHISCPEFQHSPPVSLEQYGLSAFEVWVRCPRQLNSNDTGLQNKRITVFVKRLGPSDIEHLEFVIRSNLTNVVLFVDKDGNSVSAPPHLRITPNMGQDVPRYVRVAHANTGQATRAEEVRFTVSVILPQGIEAEIEDLAFAIKMESRLRRVLRKFLEGSWAPIVAFVSMTIAFAKEIRKGVQREKEKGRRKETPRLIRRFVIILDVLLIVSVMVMFLWPQPPNTIKIGLQAPLTGEAAYEGQGFLDAVTLVADQINEKGGLLHGRKIEIVTVDDKGDAGEAVRAANELVEKDVVAVIGSYESSATGAAAAIYDEAGILHITPSATEPQLTTQGFDKFFRLAFPEHRRSLFAVDFMVDLLHTREAAIIHDNSPYAKDMADWAATHLAKEGTNVAAIESINPTETDFSSVLTKIKQAEPDVVYFTAGYSDSGVLLLAQSRDLGIESKWIMPTDASYITRLGILGPDTPADAYFVSEPLFKDIGTAKSKEFFYDFMAKYGDPPTGISWPRAADALQLIVDAIKAKKSISAEVLAEHIRDVRDFPGISGTIVGFDEEGDRLGADYAIYTIDERDNLVPYWLP